jgi:hypothetical protein
VSVCPSKVCRQRPVATSHKPQRLVSTSREREAPIGAQADGVYFPLCPSKVRRQRPVAPSHSRRASPSRQRKARIGAQADARKTADAYLEGTQTASAGDPPQAQGPSRPPESARRASALRQTRFIDSVCPRKMRTRRPVATSHSWGVLSESESAKRAVGAQENGHPRRSRLRRKCADKRPVAVSHNCTLFPLPESCQTRISA